MPHSGQIQNGVARAGASPPFRRPRTPEAAFDLYLPAFFTAKGAGTPAKSVITATADKAAPTLKPMLEAEQARLDPVRDADEYFQYLIQVT